jgi:hypothetical protein
MTKEAAMLIIEEASQDKRLTAVLDTKRTSQHHQGGYKVKLRLCRRDCNITITKAEDWPVTKDLWQGL